MRSPQTLFSFAFAFAGFFAPPFHVENKYDGFSLDAASGYFSQPDAAKKVYLFRLRGDAHAKSGELEFSAQDVGGTLVPNPALANKVSVAKAEAHGNVRVVRTVPSPKGARIASITSSDAQYAANGSSGVLRLTDPVVITDVDETKASTLIAAGKTGTVTLGLRAVAAQSSIDLAELGGGVRIDVMQEGGHSHVIATGDRLVLDNRTKPPRLTLSGGVTIHGTSGTGVGTAMSIDELVITLNESGEMTSWSVRSGGE